MDGFSLLSVLTAVGICIVSGLFLFRRHKRQRVKALQDYLLYERTPQEYQISKKLRDHCRDFEKRIVTVEGNIHVAIGFGLANLILVEGADGCILFDTMECYAAADEALDALDDILRRKPIQAVVLTHFHSDHSGGIASVMSRYPKARVFAHEKFRDETRTLMTVRAPITFRRAMFQFGSLIKEHVNSGIGHKLR